MSFGIDCNADEKHHFHTVGYSIIAGFFIIYPLSEIAYNTLINGVLSSEIKYHDYMPPLVDKYVGGTNTYSENIDNLCILPGSNLLKVIINKHKLVALNKENNVVVKVHPLTTEENIRDIKEIFTNAKVITDEYSLDSLMKQADTIYSTLTSESSIKAVLMDKDLKSLEIDMTSTYTMYANITRPLFLLPKKDRKPYLEKIIYSAKTCLISTTHPNPYEQIDICIKNLKEIQNQFKLI